MTAHVHAALMLQYAQDAAETDKPWERWQFKCPGDVAWDDAEVDLAFYRGHQYRRKPRTIKVNGFDVPEPMRDCPPIGSSYFISSANGEYFYSYCGKWDGYGIELKWLSRGLVHSKKEAAAKHAMAMCGIDPATYKDES